MLIEIKRYEHTYTVAYTHDKTAKAMVIETRTWDDMRDYVRTLLDLARYELLQEVVHCKQYYERELEKQQCMYEDMIDDLQTEVAEKNEYITKASKANDIIPTLTGNDEKEGAV